MIRSITLTLCLYAALLTSFSGCGKSTEVVQTRDSDSKAETASIVDGKRPTEAAKEAMLAAKDELFQKLSRRLMEVIGNDGPAAAIAICKDEAAQIAQQVGEHHGLKIGRTGVRLRNPSNLPPTWAEPYTEQKTETPQFFTLTSGHAAALLPIKLKAQCLMCHGPRETIAAVIQGQLAKLYPHDEATGFQEGELRGWFWIEKPL